MAELQKLRSPITPSTLLPKSTIKPLEIRDRIRYYRSLSYDANYTQELSTVWKCDEHLQTANPRAA